MSTHVGWSKKQNKPHPTQALPLFFHLVKTPGKNKICPVVTNSFLKPAKGRKQNIVLNTWGGSAFFLRPRRPRVRGRGPRCGRGPPSGHGRGRARSPSRCPGSPAAPQISGHGISPSEQDPLATWSVGKFTPKKIGPQKGGWGLGPVHWSRYQHPVSKTRYQKPGVVHNQNPVSKMAVIPEPCFWN